MKKAMSVKMQLFFMKAAPLFDGKEYSSAYSLTGYNTRKFLVPLSEVSSYDNSPMNFPILRYSDVLLMKAEALNELGQTALAEDYLNMVRNSAGLDDIQSGLSQADFKEAVLHERRIELAFEGQRWFDLIRVNNGQYASGVPALDWKEQCHSKTPFTADPSDRAG